MKNVILVLLRSGFTRTKKFRLADLTGYFYPLKYLLTEDQGMIRCNDNAFWHPENNQNRLQLYHELSVADGRKGIRAMHSLLVRFEHGDAYGIVRQTQ